MIWTERKQSSLIGCRPPLQDERGERKQWGSDDDSAEGIHTHTRTQSTARGISVGIPLAAPPLLRSLLDLPRTPNFKIGQTKKALYPK